jgi:predicted O-linked N-acetylglucosamine transferase (SPINDLY family)
MTMPFALPFPMPEDERVLTRVLARPGGLAAAPAGEQAYLGRAVVGLGLMDLVRHAERAGDDGVQVYEIWLSAHGAEAQACAAWFNLGVARMRAGNAAGAVAAYREALRLKPDMVEAAINLGTALEASGQTELALGAWRAALPPPAMRQVLHNQLGRVLETQGKLGPASEELRASLLIEPHQADVQQHLVHMRQRMTSWPPARLDVPGLTEAEAAANCGPLAALALYDDPVMQAATAEDWIRRKAPPTSERLAPKGGYAHDRIRIGYLSTDFCRHAMSFLIAELLELHDRDQFEVYGYCASPEDGSDIRARVLAAMDHHVPIKAMTDPQAAARIRADEIDILIDLNGLTRGARVGVLRWKPAPVQITYLGYIGPIPLPELDYILCDEITIPHALEPLYTPQPLRIAGCYQANDSRAPVLPQVSRVSEGLPEGVFVYCCVSHHYKITESLFGGWCDIVAGVPGSVLWLIDDNPESRAALTARWVARGLGVDRLIFAPRVDPDRYRARLALADLFLDTTPYNAGTIASDALRMGLPLLTLQGTAFAARMASSLLTAMGLTDCITTTLPGYVARAIQIGQDPGLHQALKSRLAGDAWARTLGDAAGFTRRFEAVMQQVVVKGTLSPAQTAPG